MKLVTLTLPFRLGLTTIGSLMVALALMTSPAGAQSATDLLNDPTGTGASSNPFADEDQGFNSVFDLIHRATLGSSVSIDEFNQQQQEDLTDEAAAFRERQQELFRQQTQTPYQLFAPNPAQPPVPGAEIR